MGRPRLYDVNEDFFSYIDSEAKAYWLGFIQGDGTIAWDGVRRNKLNLRVELQVADKGHIRKLLDDMESTHPIRTRPEGNMVYASIRSNKLCDHLILLGVTPRKIFTATPITVDEVLQRHYWRGLVDADGCIMKLWRGNHCYPSLELTGTHKICEGLSKFLGFNGRYVYKDKRCESFNLRISCTNARLALTAIYTSCNTFLNRKHAKCMEVLQ